MNIDEAILSQLPHGCVVINITSLRLSENCDTARIEVQLPNGTRAQFFEKSSTGKHGFELMRAHYESESSLFRFIPENIPPPIAMTTYRSDPNRHSFLMEFIDMVDDELPGPEPFMEAIASLHRESAGKSPTRKFGFSVDTKFAHLTTPNYWDASWESWWTQHMNMVFKREAQERGPRTQEEEDLVDFYQKKAIVRYIRPLESDGRSIQPTLLHTDLWPGNVKFKLDHKRVCIFDANAMWGHNESKCDMLPFTCKGLYAQQDSGTGLDRKSSIPTRAFIY
ncbi:Fructosamine kinase-domain-containing protein [Xylaria arbuscula]|nr:Fructosamine kinase-domain-containing protein [Xylaria arbuscula]